MSEKIERTILQFLDAKRRSVVEAVIDEGSQRKAAVKLGLAQSTVAFHVMQARDEAALRGWAPEYDRDHPVPRSEYISGVSTCYNGDGEVTQQWVKTKADASRISLQLEAFAESLAESVKGKFKSVKTPKLDFSDDISTQLIIGDMHLGMRAWADETLSDNHDLDIATRDLMGGMRYLISSSVPCKRFCIVSVGDTFHANDSTSRTPNSGHKLDVDSRHKKVMERAAQIFEIGAEEALKHHETVEILLARGNHDGEDATGSLELILSAYFKDEPRVKIHPTEAKWLSWKHGKTSVFVNHGEKNINHLYEYLTNVFRRRIGESNHIYTHLGHYHTKRVEDKGAIRFEIFNPLIPPDKWHADESWGPGKRSITSISYSKEHGEVSRTTCSLDMIRGMYEV